MTRQWQPGDVGVTIPLLAHEKEHRFIVVEKDGETSFHYSDGDRMLMPPRDNGRPLVVIDPDDGKQVERLALLIWPERLSGPLSDRSFLMLADALRDFGKPTLPPEPTGLGAVIEDVDGDLWVRVEQPDPDDPHWFFNGRDEDSCCVRWSDLDVAKVLTPGVTR